MATFKAEVYAHQKKQDGTYNIKIRVTHNQKKKYLRTTYYVSKDDLTRNLKIKNQYYIDETDKLIRKYRKACDSVGERLKNMSIDQVVDLISSDNSLDNFDLDIVAYGRGHVKHLIETGHAGNAKTYDIALNNLVKFVGRENISIKEITVKFLKNYIKWINEQPARSNRVKGNRAQSLYLSNLRAIHNLAKDEFNEEELGLIRIPLSPFKKIKLPKVPISRKRALDTETLREIASLEYTANYQVGVNRFNFAKDMFILSFGLIGMNAIDLYNCTNYKKGRITYNRTKTKNRREDRAEISIKVEPEIKPLIDKYRDPSGERVFKFYKMYSSIDTFTTAINGFDRTDTKGNRQIVGLKKIGNILDIEDLQFYAARHSWATIATNEAGVDKFIVHSALNHVDEEMKITDIYIKKSWDPIDKANRKVLDFVKLEIGNVEEPTYKEYLLKQKNKQSESKQGGKGDSKQ